MTGEGAAGAPVPRRRAAPVGRSNRLLSAREVGEMLGVPERTVRAQWRTWGLPAYRIGKHLRWRERDVHHWIDHHKPRNARPGSAPALRYWADGRQWEQSVAGTIDDSGRVRPGTGRKPARGA